MPPITTVASGRCTSAPAPVAIAIGRKPMLATSAVEMTGRSRSMAPSRTASSLAMPSPRRWLMWSTITRPFNIAMPDSAMKPIAAVIEKGMARTASANTPPVTASGMPANTISAWETEPSAP